MQGRRGRLKPVPVGWEQLPVNEGSLSEERTKTKAPATARSGSASRLSFTSRFSWYTPKTMKGRETRNQISHQGLGKNPSIMCILSLLTALAAVKQILLI